MSVPKAVVPGGPLIRYSSGTPLTNLYATALDMLGVPAERFGDSTGKFEHATEPLTGIENRERTLRRTRAGDRPALVLLRLSLQYHRSSSLLSYLIPCGPECLELCCRPKV